VNPNLDRLQPYPFQKLNNLYHGVTPNADLAPIYLHIGEPKHPTPEFIRARLAASLEGLARYPATLGAESLRHAIAGWLQARHRLRRIDPAREIIPVNGSREALFGFAQAVIDASRPDPVVVAPNPFYQIYEGAALLAGARPEFINTLAESGFAFDPEQLPADTWRKVQLVYVCTPGNPTGAVMTLAQWRALFDLSDRHGFIIASDECYSEIYFDEDDPPLGGLQAAQRLGRDGFPRLVVFSSLSKRSNVPGMRSGFVAGDAAILNPYLLYRTYQGGAMSPPILEASVAAWRDEAHVRENRRLYREKFDAVLDVLGPSLGVTRPQAAFYLWPRTPLADAAFAQRLFREYNVTVLPGSFLGRDARGVNPGAGYARIALVAPLAECVEAAQRIKAFIAKL